MSKTNLLIEGRKRARHIIDMVWLYRSTMPPFQDYQNSRRLEEGRRGQSLISLAAGNDNGSQASYPQSTELPLLERPVRPLYREA